MTQNKCKGGSCIFKTWINISLQFFAYEMRLISARIFWEHTKSTSFLSFVWLNRIHRVLTSTVRPRSVMPQATAVNHHLSVFALVLLKYYSQQIHALDDLPWILIRVFMSCLHRTLWLFVRLMQNLSTSWASCKCGNWIAAILSPVSSDARSSDAYCKCKCGEWLHYFAHSHSSW